MNSASLSFALAALFVLGVSSLRHPHIPALSDFEITESLRQVCAGNVNAHKECESALAVRGVLASSGYTVEGINRGLLNLREPMVGSVVAPLSCCGKHMNNKFDRPGPATKLEVLVQLLLLGLPVDKRDAVVPLGFVSPLLEAGVLVELEDVLYAAAMITPVDLGRIQVRRCLQRIQIITT